MTVKSLLFIKIFLLVLISSNLHSQPCKWEWQNPKPVTGNNLNDVHIIDKNIIEVFGDNGTILRTTNNGDSWSNYSYGNYNLKRSCYLDEMTAMAVGDSGTIIRTDDGGITWKNLSTNSKTNYYGISIIDKNQAWVSGDSGTIIKTTDGGDSWFKQESGSIYRITDIQLLDQNTGYASTSGQLLKTTDGGSNWKVVVNNLYSNVDIFFINSLVGWFGGYNTTLSKTSDGGLTSVKKDLYLEDHSKFIKKIQFINENIGWIIIKKNGEIYSNILFTSDGGTEWESIFYSKVYDLNDFHFIDTNTAWTVGNNGVMLYTTNGGAGWIDKQSLTIRNFIDADFINNKTGWALGDQEYHDSLIYIYKTTDSGESWMLKTIDFWYTPHKIDFVDVYTGWITFSSGRILKTTDGGDTWFEQVSNVHISLESIYFIDKNNGWAGGSNGEIIKTTDGGENWLQLINFTYYPINNIFFADNNYGWVLFYDKIVCTTDGGKTWNYQIGGNKTGFSQVFFVNRDLGFISGSSGIIKTTNGGNKWSLCLYDTTTNRRFNSVFFVDENKGWTVTNDGKIFKTTDGGSNWNNEALINKNCLNYVCFPGENIGWAVGNKGTILRHACGPVDVEENADVSSDIRVFPNPATEVINLEITTDCPGSCQIKVFNSYGEIILADNFYLFNKKYQYSIATDNLTSGTYYFVLNSDGNAYYQKIIVLK